MTIDPAILTLAAGIIVQLIVISFWAGVMTARIRTLEKQMEPMLTLAGNVGVLGAQMIDVKHELEELNKTLSWMKRPDPRLGGVGPP